MNKLSFHWGALLLIVFALGLGGCKTTRTKIIHVNDLNDVLYKDENGQWKMIMPVDKPDPNEVYKQSLEAYRADPTSMGFSQLWHDFAQSDFLAEVPDLRRQIDQIQAQMQSGQGNCLDTDWQGMEPVLFFSPAFHSLAQTCFDQQGMSEKVDYYANALVYVFKGLFKRDGRSQEKAIEVPTGYDAEDIVELSGYQVFDSYVELGQGNRGMYTVYVVNDPQTQEQFSLYFDYTRYLHKALGIEYPFAWIDNTIYTEIAEPYAEKDYRFKYAKAQALESQLKYDEAAQTYLDAISKGAIIAGYRLAKLCQGQQLTLISKEECFDYMLEAADQGYAYAIVEVAFALRSGQGVDQDVAAYEQLMTQVEQYLPNGLAWYHQMMLTDDSALIDEFFNKAVKAGYARAKLFSGLSDIIKALGSDEEQNIDQKLFPYYQMAESGNADAQLTYAKLLMTIQKNDELQQKIMHYLKAAAQQGSVKANYELGLIYRYGTNVPVDYPKAHTYFLEAANRFHLNAQLELGIMYEQGKVARDNEKALLWYTMCVGDKGFHCSHNIGLLIMNGKVKGATDADAVDIFKALAEVEDAGGMNSYGYMLEEGRGVEKDVKAAIEYYKKSAEKGNRWAQRNLCVKYYYGDEIEQDLKKAKSWCEAAAAQGHQSAIRFLKNFE